MLVLLAESVRLDGILNVDLNSTCAAFEICH